MQIFFSPFYIIFGMLTLLEHYVGKNIQFCVMIKLQYNLPLIGCGSIHGTLLNRHYSSHVFLEIILYITQLLKR